MKINEITRDVLANCRTEGNVLYLPNQLDRTVYTNVNKVLEAIGGKWNRKARGHVFDESPEDIIEEILLTGECTDKRKTFQFFETPDKLAVRLCDMAEITSDCTCLEPSVGRGKIADEIMKRCHKSLICVEVNEDMKKYLKDKEYRVIFKDFLEVSDADVKADRIIMNPPFSKQQDIDHVYKAFSVLNPGGILVSVMSLSHTFRTDRKSCAFRNFLEEHNAKTEILPEGAFKESGTMVKACIEKIRKAGVGRDV